MTERDQDDFIRTGAACSFLQAMTRAQPWADRAACKDSDELFLVEPGGGKEAPATVVSCFLVCRGCPVRAECLRDALSARFSPYGVWGGSTQTERRPLVPRLFDDSERFKAPNADDLKRIEQAAEYLERTFEKRLRAWRRLAGKTVTKSAA